MKLITILAILLFLVSCSVKQINLPEQHEEESVSLSKEIGLIIGKALNEFTEGILESQE